MIWLDCGSQGRRGKLEGGAAEVRPVLELMASHGKNPTSLALLCRLQSASSEAGLPGSSVQNTSTHDLPLSDCHKGAVIQGLPRPSESHTCSLPPLKPLPGASSRAPRELSGSTPWHPNLCPPPQEASAWPWLPPCGIFTAGAPGGRGALPHPAFSFRWESLFDTWEPF